MSSIALSFFTWGGGGGYYQDLCHVMISSVASYITCPTYLRDTTGTINPLDRLYIEFTYHFVLLGSGISPQTTSFSHHIVNLQPWYLNTQFEWVVQVWSLVLSKHSIWQIHWWWFFAHWNVCAEKFVKNSKLSWGAVWCELATSHATQTSKWIEETSLIRNIESICWRLNHLLYGGTRLYFDNSQTYCVPRFTEVAIWPSHVDWKD